MAFQGFFLCVNEYKISCLVMQVLSLITVASCLFLCSIGLVGTGYRLYNFHIFKFFVNPDLTEKTPSIDREVRCLGRRHGWPVHHQGGSPCHHALCWDERVPSLWWDADTFGRSPAKGL